jgi:hypothetical protein
LEEIVGQRKVQVIGWSKAIDWRSKFDWNEIIDWKLGIGRGGVIDRKLHPLCMVHNTYPVGVLGRTGSMGLGSCLRFLWSICGSRGKWREYACRQ